MPEFLTCCSRDCFDTCFIKVTVEGRKVTAVRGAEAAPTSGFLCRKGRTYVDYQNNPLRLTHPILRRNGGDSRISWDDALALMAEQLERIKASAGTEAVLYLGGAGSLGLMQGLVSRFFNAYGGVTVPEGSLCWGAGIAAQQFDFGANMLHSPDDLQNSQLILLWGRDPEKTNTHLVPYIREALARGARLAVINPIPTAFHGKADLVVSPRPATDGALALGVAGEILRLGLAHTEFLERHTLGAEAYLDEISRWSAERTAAVCGIAPELVTELARAIGSSVTAIYMGFGLQRYSNGGETIRAIDALGAISGNVGRAGGGVQFASTKGHLFGSIKGKELGGPRRRFRWGTLANDMSAADPPIQAVFIERCNPAEQLSDKHATRQALARVPFKVVFDLLPTATTELADLVLPVTSLFEREDIYNSYSHNFVGYGPAVADPPGECLDDEEIWSRLARLMGLPGGFERPREEWLTMLLEPLRGAGITLETLKLGPQELPLPDVPFADGVFPTPDGKMRISGEYRPPVEGIADGTPDETYPLQLISPHSAYRINSQFDGLTGQYALEHTRQLASSTAKNEAAAADRVAFSGADRFSERTEENLPGPLVRISDALRQRLGLTFGDYVRVSTARGHLIGRLGEATAQRDDVVAIEQGGTQVNLLTRQGVSEIGLTTAFYDCRCRIDPA